MDKKCPNCSNALPEEASFCMHCFTPLNVTPQELNENKTGNSKKIIVLILFVLCAVIFISTFICVHNSKNHDDSKYISTEHTTTINTATTEQTTTKKAVAIQKTTVTKSTTKSTSTSTTVASTSMQQKTTKATTKQASTKINTTKKATTIKPTSPPPVVIEGGTLSNYPADRTSSSYTIPNSVTRISGDAFNNNKYLKTLKFSKRETVDCDWRNLFLSLPNLETVYIYPGTSADLEGLQYFDGEIVYYDWWF